MTMAIIGLRLLVCLLTMVYGLFSAGVFIVFGMDSRAQSAIIITMIVTWLVRPEAGDVAAFAEFQRQRLDDDA